MVVGLFLTLVVTILVMIKDIILWFIFKCCKRKEKDKVPILGVIETPNLPRIAAFPVVGDIWKKRNKKRMKEKFH